MLSLRLQAPRSFVTLNEEIPVLPGPGWLCVRLVRGLVCGTDLPYFNGRKPIAFFPMQPGRPIHECAGIVQESSSSSFKAGDRVVAMPDADQGLREYYLAREADACLVPPEVENWDLAVLIQPLCTVIYGVEKLGNVTGKHVTVVGAGAIGLLSTWLLNQLGAGPITVIDPVQARLDLAKELGASRTFAWESGQILSLHRNNETVFDGAEVVVEAVGHQTETLNHCLGIAEKGGTVLALGVPDQPVYPFEFNLMFRKNLTLIGSVTPPWREYLQKAGALVGQHPELARLVTDRFPLDKAEEAYKLAESRGSAGKVAIHSE